MKPLDTITLKAFLVALAQLDSVPSQLRTQLNHIGFLSSASIGRLHSIAEAYPSLYKFYQEARLIIGNDSERNKGPIPKFDREIENASEELVNLADEIFKSSNLVSTIRVKSNQPGVLMNLLNLVRQSKP
jgi:hypothetical protein